MHIEPSYLSTSHSTSFLSSQCNTSTSQIGSPKFFRKQKIFNRETKKQKDADEAVFKFLSPKSNNHTFDQTDESNQSQIVPFITRTQRKTFNFSKNSTSIKKNELQSKNLSNVSNSSTTITLDQKSRKNNLEGQFFKVSMQLQNMKRDNIEMTTQIRQKSLRFQLKEQKMLKKIKQLETINQNLNSKIYTLEQMISEKVYNMSLLQSRYKQMQQALKQQSKGQELKQTKRIIDFLETLNKGHIEEIINKTKLLKYQNIENNMMKRKLEEAKTLLNDQKKAIDKNKNLNNVLSFYKEKLKVLMRSYKQLQNGMKQQLKKRKKSVETLFSLSQDEQDEFYEMAQISI